MGDVTASRKQNSRDVYSALNSLVADARKATDAPKLSPLTVTLGDEFQGVLGSVVAGVETIFWFQEQRFARQLPFELHFSLVWGEIDTDINPDIAHGMLGEGLSQARDMLTRKDRARPCYQVDVGLPTQTRIFNHLFSVLEDIESRWSTKDYDLVLGMLRSDSDAEIGKAFGKDRSQIWRRRKTLQTDMYNATRAAIHDLAVLGNDMNWWM